MSGIIRSSFKALSTGVQSFETFLSNSLHLVIFFTIFGSTPILHLRMVEAGIPDSNFLWIAIACVDLLIVASASWGVAGLVLATLMCGMVVSVILGYAGEYAPALFTLTSLFGNIGSFVLKQAHKKQHQRDVVGTEKAGGIQFFTERGQLDPSTVKGMSHEQLRETFGLSHRNAKELRKILSSGKTVHKDWFQTKKDSSPPSVPKTAT